MSAKNNDMQGRFRKIVVAFRVSQEESDVINRMVALSGLTKQDYLIRCTSNTDIVVQGNPYVYRSLKYELKHFIDEFKQLENLEEIELDDLIVLRRVLKLLLRCMIKKWHKLKFKRSHLRNEVLTS